MVPSQSSKGAQDVSASATVGRTAADPTESGSAGRTQFERIPNLRLLAYSSLTFPIVAVGMPITTFLPPLYAGQGGLGLATVGLIFLVARIWDVVSDPIVGLLVDRFQWRRHRRKAWIALSVPFLWIPAFFLYMPKPGEPASAAALLAQLLLIYTGWTILQTAHQAWGADLTPNYDERSRLYGFREIVNVSGSLFILVLPALAATWITFDEYLEVATMGLFLIVTLPLTLIFAFALVPDGAQSKRTASKQRLRLGDLIDGMKDRTMIRILAIEISVGIGVGVTAATFLFVARGIVGFTSGASSALLVYFISSIVGIPIWLWLSRRLEKHLSLQIACTYSLFGNLILIPVLMAPSQLTFVIMIAVLGLGFGAPQALVRSMMADQIDHEEVRSGMNKAGLYFAFMGTAYKLGQALAIAISFSLLALIGFDPERPADPAYHGGLIAVMTLVPALTLAICILLCRNYPLTRDAHKQDRLKLEEQDR